MACISLRYNDELSLQGVQQLAKDNWPMLCELDIIMLNGQRVLSKSAVAMLAQSFHSPFVRIIISSADWWGRLYHECTDEDSLWYIVLRWFVKHL